MRKKVKRLEIRQDILDVVNKILGTDLKLSSKYFAEPDFESSYFHLDTTLGKPRYGILISTGAASYLSFDIDYIEGECPEDFKVRLHKAYLEERTSQIRHLEAQIKELVEHSNKVWDAVHEVRDL